MSSRARNTMLYILLIIVIGWIIFSFFGKEEIRNLPSTNTGGIVAFGDSLVYGVGSTSGNDFISLLSNRIAQPILNKGVSGDTTRKGLARIDEIVALRPQLVIILLGGNDYLQKIPQEETFANLATIVARAHQAGAAVLLLGVRGGLLRDTYGGQFKDFAKANKVAFVPNVLDNLIGNREYMSDTIHPNDVGYAKIADKIEPVLRDILKRQNP